MSSCFSLNNSLFKIQNCRFVCTLKLDKSYCWLYSNSKGQYQHFYTVTSLIWSIKTFWNNPQSVEFVQFFQIDQTHIQQLTPTVKIYKIALSINTDRNESALATVLPSKLQLLTSVPPGKLWRDSCPVQVLSTNANLSFLYRISTAEIRNVFTYIKKHTRRK